MVSWMVLPWHDATIRTFPEESALVTYLGQRVPEPGLYAFPSWDTAGEGAWESFEQRHEAGPVGMLVLAEGSEPMSAQTMLTGLGIHFLTALLAAWLLSVAHLPSFGQRLAFVVTLGLLIGITADGLYWNWLHMPGLHTLVMIADRVAGLFLLGLVLAALVRPRTTVVKAPTATASNE